MKQSRIHLAGVTLIMCTAAAASSPNYQYSYQYRTGDLATFNAAGPATGENPDVQGDAFLASVEYPAGGTYIHYYKPVNVSNIRYKGRADKWVVRGGTNVTIGVQGDTALTSGSGNIDYRWTNPGNSGGVSSSSAESFRLKMLEALSNNNLNNYVDLGGSDPRFSFIMEFDMMVMDNDPDADDFGEILYFERGAGSGNSWLKMRAVDENGTALGPWLVIGPDETVQTSPVTTVYNSSQTMGTTSIDVSRLGVTEFQYLEVSNDVNSEPAYTGGGDTAPDFKVMAVITNESQLSDELSFD